MPRTKNLFPNIAAFLDLIAYAEGTSRLGSDDGYNVIVGGTFFTSYKDHPKVSVYLPKYKINSTCAGRYQIKSKYYAPYSNLLNLTNFGPEAQDKIAMRMIREQGAWQHILNGDIETAIHCCANIWASFPGAGYGQRELKLGEMLKKFVEFGGNLK